MPASNNNDSERPHYLVNYLTQGADSERMGLLKTALSERNVGQPIDELKIDIENKNNFRTLLVAQVGTAKVGTATERISTNSTKVHNLGD